MPFQTSVSLRENTAPCTYLDAAETMDDKDKIFVAKMERNFVLIAMWKQPECALGCCFYMHSTKGRS
jgi:hypothetical protein